MVSVVEGRVGVADRVSELADLLASDVVAARCGVGVPDAFRVEAHQPIPPNCPPVTGIVTPLT